MTIIRDKYKKVFGTVFFHMYLHTNGRLNEINESFKQRDKIDINSILDLIDENDENENDYSINENKYYELEIDSGATQWFQRE